MRFRRVRLSDGSTCAAAWDAAAERWLPLRPALDEVGDASTFAELRAADDDIVGLLAGGGAVRDAVEGLVAQARERDFGGRFELAPLLPLQPRLLRAFANSERHWMQSARGLVRDNMPHALRAIEGVEKVIRRPFPRFRPGKLFYDEPAFYIGNALTILPGGATVPWPSYTSRFDFELELAAVVAKPLRNATPEQAREAIGGFVVFNDFSARDTQWREFRGGLFGPVVKTKSFASAMSAEVVSADEIWPHVRDLTGEVRVNGEVWTRTSTADAQWGYDKMAVHASLGEQVVPGELLSGGTLPGGCGLELDRWLQPGDEVELSIERVGTLANRVGEPERP
jgi:2-keto-4-pentenoate hydratase/2-oxohepta-3-ene-1,7-dioic acid hydratase in catechol pathway